MLVAELLSIDSLGGHEQHLVVSAVTDDGKVLSEDDPEKLLRMPVTEVVGGKPDQDRKSAQCSRADLAQRKNRLAEQSTGVT